MLHTAHFRFYEELNDFLPPNRRKQTIAYHFKAEPGITDPIEALGVPHTEVELIIVHGRSVGFDHRLRHGDRVAVYPVFESLDVMPLLRLRDKPLRNTAFILDVNLGKLARKLRLFGFDAAYRNDYSDAEVVAVSLRTGRIILTRDRRLLYPKVVTHGYWVRAARPEEQIREVLIRFDLRHRICAFHRCLDCNGLIEPVAKAAVLAQLQPLTKRYYDEFFRCRSCAKVYWKGTHYERMQRTIAQWTS